MRHAGRAMVMAIMALLPAVLRGHPLDESGIYHFTRIVPVGKSLQFETVLAYKPYLAYFEGRDIDRNRDGVHDAAELARYAEQEYASPAAQVVVLVNGEKRAVTVERASRIAGELGLFGELEFVFTFELPLDGPPGQPITVTFIDDYNPAKLESYKTGGINEIEVVTASPWFAISDIEFKDFGHPGVNQLFWGVYPRTADIRQVAFTVTPREQAFGCPILAAAYEEARVRHADGALPWAEAERLLALAREGRTATDAPPTTPRSSRPGKRPASYSNPATAFFFKQVPALFRAATTSVAGWWLLLALAFVYGMQHAFMPGHGKGLIAAYLIGSNAGVREAISLGAIVTVAHTGSVIVLGTAIYLWLHQPDRGVGLPALWPFWLVSGAGIMAIGGWMLARRYRHGTDHGGDDGQERPSGKRPSRREVFLLGLSGGMIPCPSALLILNMAILLDAIRLGYLTVLAFSLGIAAALITIGVLAVKGKQLAAAKINRGFFRRINPERELFIELDAFGLHACRLLPYISLAAIIVIGAGIACFGIWLKGQG